MLFEDLQRTRVSGKRWAESDFTFLDQSSWPRAQRVRSLMNDWYAEYPESSRYDLKRRFQSKDYRQHLGALTELFLHALFRRSSYDIDVVPAGPDNTSRPDFFLSSKIFPKLDLEATTIGLSPKESAQVRRVADLLDTVDRMKVKDFMFGVRTYRGPDTNPPARKLRYQLEQWLSKHNADEVPATRSLDHLPTFIFKQDEWEIKFYAVPQKPEFRDVALERPTVFFWTGSVKLEIEDDIRKAIKRKAGKYDLRERSYVIAIGFIGEKYPKIHEHICDELFRTLTGYEPMLIRTGRRVEGHVPDGIFYGPDGNKNLHVSGVVLVPHLDVWRIGEVKPIYMGNPLAKHPLRDFPSVFDRWVIKDVGEGKSRFEHRPPELALRKLFGLAGGWPVGEDDDDIDWGLLKQELQSD